MMNTNKFEEININDCKKVNGGLVAGALLVQFRRSCACLLHVGQELLMVN